jgi:short-subunit dehydrogenase
MPKPIPLRGGQVLITGASSGIGRALAVQLAGEGAVLALAARRTALLDELADEIEAAGHARPQVLTADLAVPDRAADLATRAIAAFDGRIDMLVNNAGANLIGPQATLADSDAARSVFETNFWTPLALTAAVLPGMRAQGQGLIVNVTSTVQAVPIPLLGYYAASKAALAQATRALRHELADTPVRVLEVIPGSTNTALRDIDELPWKGAAPRTLPPVSPASTAAAITKAIRRGSTRVMHPSYSLVPLEVPLVGRIVAAVAGSRVDTLGALDNVEGT